MGCSFITRYALTVRAAIAIFCKKFVHRLY